MEGHARSRNAERQGIGRAWPWLAAALLASGCATGAGGRADEDAAALARQLREAAPPDGALVVRLAFGEAGDLDLYVTGPLHETVYYANSPTRIGGRLLGDRRCDAPAPRIETVVFDPAPPGRYRVGVDLPERCDGGRGALPFALEVRAPSGVRTREGRLAPGVFEPIVLEWREP